MNENNFDVFNTDTDATSTDAGTEQLIEINNTLVDIKYTLILFLMLWCVLMCKKIIHNAIRSYMDITNK